VYAATSIRARACTVQLFRLPDRPTPGWRSEGRCLSLPERLWAAFPPVARDSASASGQTI